MNTSEHQQFAQGLVGRVIAGRYRLDKVLGIGGTGVVYKATTLEDGHVVAVKTIRKDLAHKRALARFFRGARLASGLNHPGLVPTLAYGQAKGVDTMPFQVMPYVDGPSWENLVPDQLEVSEKVGLICQVLDALAYVHARGVLHRDIKPANILFERQPDGSLRPMIMDFGISAAFRGGAEDIHITGTSALVGTPAFMAPEQAQQGAMNGPELDLYAVGVMMYWMLSGRLPFQGTPMEMLAAKATSRPPPLQVDGLDPGIAAAVGRLIAKEPHHRFALAAQARRAFEMHATPLVVSDARLETLFTRRARVPPVRPPAMQWTPPGADTLQREWPTLVIAEHESQSVDALAGRDGALGAIESVARRAERGEVCLVSVIAEPGMGKTSVLERVTSQLVEQGRFLVLRAPYFEASAQAGGVRRGVERMLGVYGMSRTEVREAVETLLARYDDVFPEEVDQLVDCLRPSDELAPEALNSRLGEHMMVVARLFRRLSRTRPLLVLIDDADRASTDLARFLEFMLLESRYDRWPMMVLCSVSVGTDHHAYWQAAMQSDVLNGSAHTRIQLHKLPIEPLAMDLTRRYDLSQPQARRIAKLSSGNPLHANQLAQYLSADDSLLKSVDISISSGVRALPSALLDLMKLKLEAQLENLCDSSAVQRVLQSMAVLGLASDEDLVLAMLDADGRAGFERSLDTLLQMGVVGIVEHSEPIVLGFTPALLRDAVLDSMSPEALAELHQRAVSARLALDGLRRRSHWGAVGDHQAALGQMSAASKYWLRGMYFELSKGNVMRGLEWGTQAIDHMDPQSPDWSYTTLLVATMAFDAGEQTIAETLMRRVFDSEDVDRRLQAGDLLCDLLENRGDAQAWGELIEQMNAWEDAAGDVGRCALHCARSMWLTSVGRSMDGLIEAQRALRLAESGPPAQRAAQRLAFACLPQMELDEALSAAQRSLLEAGEVPLLKARSLRVLGLVQLWQRQPAAVPTLESVPVLCRATGLMTRYPIALHDLGDAYRLNGQVEEARKKYQETIGLCDGLPLSSTLALCRFKLVICDILDGRVDAVFDRMDVLVEQGTSVGLGNSKRFGALLCGWARLVQGDVAKGVASLQAAGPLDTILVDPQVPSMLKDCCERLVQAVLSSNEALVHIKAVLEICRQAREVFGISGDMAQLQQIERLIQRLPQVPI